MPDHGSPFDDMERLVRAALARVDPPVHLQRRVEQTLDSVLELAADELESWELVAIKDPRNWPRAAIGPATAVVVGSGAAGGPVVLRAPRKRPQRPPPAKGPRGPAPP